jgi:chitodextrinase
VVAAYATSHGVSRVTAAGDPVIAAAGDIACDPADSHFNGGNGTSKSCRQKWTSNLLVNNPALAGVLTLGDNQYYCGSLTAFQQVFDPTWGREKPILHPAPGNHEYLTSGGTGCDATNANAAGYFNYFGTLAGTVAPGKGYYSYDIGTWHFVSLNSQCSAAGGCSATSPQGKWLAADLAAHTGYCTVAYWHVPLYSSGGRASSVTQALWQILYNNQVDLVLNGHDHIYERFAPQDPNANVDTVHGIREFIAGTGGNNHTSIVSVAPNSEVRDTTTFGVLQLTLHPTGYDWQFVPDSGSGTFTDSGSGSCHDGPVTPTGLAAATPSATGVDLSWTAAAARANPVSGYRIYRNGVQIGTSAGTTYADTTALPGTTYSYAVDAVDSAGGSSPQTAAVSATTPAPPDSTPPTAPTNLSATAVTAAEIDLSWTASTDNVAVAGYKVFRNGTQIATTGGTTYADKGLAASTTFSYTVYAYDAAGNVSPASNTASATTLADTTPPTAPTNLTATAVSTSQVNLSWTASTDNVGVAGYTVYRNGVSVATVATTAYSDTGLQASTGYAYTVAAFDSAGNVSPLSNQASATTLASGATLFSDGFESGGLSNWTVDTGVSAQQSLVFDGSWAARMTSAGAQTYATKTLSSTVTEATYSLEFRIVSQGANNINLIKFRTGANASIGAIYVTSTDSLALRNDVAGVSTTSTTNVSQGVWHSLRWHVIIGGTTSSLAEVWLDGVKVDALTRTDSLGTAPVGIVQLGENSTGRTYDVAYDDVLVTTP